MLDAPTKGRVEIHGSPVASFADRQLAGLRNREIGFVFQTFHLVNDLSVLDNVQIPLLYRRMSNGERRKMALAASRPATWTRRWATRSWRSSRI